MGRRRRRRKPKPVINYPPLTTRTWIPPDKRRKRKRKLKYPKYPPQLNTKLEQSSLRRVWHSYKVIHDCAMLFGHYSQNHHKFLYTSNGLQGSCSCVVAILFSKIWMCPHWNAYMLDQALNLGDMYYRECRKIHKTQELLRIPDLIRDLYLYRYKITVDFKGKIFTGMLQKVPDSKSDDLYKVITQFFSHYDSGVITVQVDEKTIRFFAIWRYLKGFYLFDPTPHDEMCWPWKGLPGKGVSFLVRFPTTAQLVTVVIRNIGDINYPFEINPIGIERIVYINTVYPSCLQDAHLEEIDAKLKKLNKDESRIVQKQPKSIPSVVMIEQIPEEDDDVQEEQPPPEVSEVDTNEDGPRTKRLKRKVLIDKPRVDSVTYFSDLVPERIGIMLANTHHYDPAFEPCPERHGLCSSVAAIIMLRTHKARHWTTTILSNVLRLGFRICIQTKKAIPSTSNITIKTMIKKIGLCDVDYTPKFDEYAAVGRLRSLDPYVLDLQPALKEVLTKCDTVIVRGPITCAVWKEDEWYYFFDPNERDPRGAAIVHEEKDVKDEEEGEESDVVIGVAVLISFRDLTELVEQYMKNIPKSMSHDVFIITGVDVRNYVPLPENWQMFTAIDSDRWILRGWFSQADRRFDSMSRNTQCLANCTIAISLAHIKPIASWDAETVNDVLENGDRYYKECVDDLTKRDKFKSHMLMACELMDEFYLKDKLICLSLMDCLVNGVVTYWDNYKGKMNLEEGLKEFFLEHDYAILVCRGISVAIWRHGEAFYYFDSHDRNNKGFVTARGKAFVQRVTNIEKLSQCIMANLNPDIVHAVYNLNAIEVEVLEPPSPDEPPDEDDEMDEAESEYGEEDLPLRERINIIFPPYEYTRITKKRSILRSQYHQGSVPIFIANPDKQTIPNLLSCLVTFRVFDPRRWNAAKLDEVLVRGDAIYKESMAEYYKRQAKRNLQEEEDEDEGDDINMGNVVKKFYIGVNKILVDFQEYGKGTIGEDGGGLKELLMAFFREPVQTDNDHKELIIETTQDYTVVIWKAGGLYYLFDPTARDYEGKVYGMADWSEVVHPPPLFDMDTTEGTTIPTSDMTTHDESSMEDAMNEQEGEEMFDKIEDYLEYGMEEILSEEFEPERIKKPPGYWEHLRETEGAACVLWFTKREVLVKYILENHEPKLRDETEFTLTRVYVLNEPELRDAYDPSMGQKVDDIQGDWHQFNEISKGYWILRGSMAQNHLLFPERNRNHQSQANCLIALAYASLYGISRFNKHTVDDILKYGDRLYTHTKKLRRKELAKIDNPPLTPAEIEEVVNTEHCTIRTLCKNFCIGDESVSTAVEMDHLMGEVTAQDVEEVLDLTRGVDKFFQDNQYGLLVAKGNAVAMWKIREFFYMFDPRNNGPDGRRFENGVGCITRFITTSPIAEIFLANLPQIGKNFFTIHKVTPSPGICDKPIKVETRRVDDPLKITGFTPIIPGKFLIRGGCNQDDFKFGRGTNAQCAPIATVALAMTLVHHCEYWTKLIIDEIINIGDHIYGEVLEKCDFNFNPWEQRLTVAMSPVDFKIGKIKVNWETRLTVQSGIIDTKDPNIYSLRRGVERFFEENSYGIIESDFLTVAIWEAEDGEDSNYIYMFDPNPRGPTAQPMQEGGTACALKFCGAKALADHFISLVHSDADGQYLITPIEIVIDRNGKKKMTKRYGMKKSVEKTPAELAKLQKLGRMSYYKAPKTDYEILRGSKSQNSKTYCLSSRGNQDVPNCIMAYVMDKLIPICRWNYKTIDMILDIGDQLYKDSYIVYNPKDMKLRLETLIRDVVVKDVRVRISVGAPVLTARFTLRLLTEALQACFNLKAFCIVLVDDSAIAVFKKDDVFYMFDPTELNLCGCRAEGGSAAVLRVQDLPSVIRMLIRNMCEGGIDHEVFHVIVVGIREIERVKVGATFADVNPKVIKHVDKPDPCDKILHGHPKLPKL